MFEASCAPQSPEEVALFRGTVPHWGQLNFTSTAPVGTSITFEVRAADTLAGLASTPVVALPPAPMGAPTRPTSLDLRAILQRASTPGYEPWHRRYLQLTARLTPALDSSISPTLVSLEVQYVCLPGG